MPKSYSNWDDQFFVGTDQDSPTKKLACLNPAEGPEMKKPMPILPKMLKITDKPVECPIKTIIFK